VNREIVAERKVGVTGLGFVAVGVVGIELGISFGERLFGKRGEKFFEGGVAKIDARGFRGGIARLAFGFGFFGFAAGHEFFGDANLGDVFVERGVVWAEKVKVFFLDFAEEFAGEAALFVFNGLGDVRAFDPLAEFEFFLFGRIGLGEGEPVALDLEVIVSEGGTAKAGDIVGELAEGVPFALGIGFGIDEASHGGVLELGPQKEFGGQ